MESLLEDYNEAYNQAVTAIVNLREAAEAIRSKADEIIDACETIEDEL